jgi:hypothetical protein
MNIMDAMGNSQNPFDYYSTAALVDRIVFEVSYHHITENGNIKWRNLDYAAKFLHRYFVYKQPKKFAKSSIKIHHEFQIRKHDLNPQLIETLESKTFDDLNTIMVAVVRRILISVDAFYYHTSSIHGKIRWRFVNFICLT